MSSSKDKIMVDKQYFDELISLSEKNSEIKGILQQIIKSHEENEKGKVFLLQVEDEMKDRGIEI